MSAWTPEAVALSAELAESLGQQTWLDDRREVTERFDADIIVRSRTRADIDYPMVITPEGIAIHQGWGCEHEVYGGPMGCWHSKEFSTMTQALVKAESVLTPAPIEFSAEQIQVIKETIARGATDAELQLFVATCRRTGLDPFMRQIYAVKRWDSTQGKEAMAIQVGIDGMRLIAERTSKYDGQDPVEWLDVNGVWSEVWSGDGPHPIAARCAVYRKDWTAGRKVTAVCRWDSYAQYFGKEQKLSPTWAKMPDVMLGKCAEALALRRAFPAEMSALAASIDSGYDPAADAAEMAQADPDAFEGQYREVPERIPLNKKTADALTEAYHKVREAVGQQPFMKGVRVEMQKRWPRAFGATVNKLAELTEEEAFDVLAFLHDQMPDAEPEQGEEPEEIQPELV